MTKHAARRKQLLDRLNELDHRLHDIEAELDAETSKNWEDAAIEHEADEVLEGLGEAGQREIAGIRAALKRMADGLYGDCVRCGNEISAERLDVLPATPFCRRCAT